MAPAFERYIGIDYSGAETPTSSLKGLRVYIAESDRSPREAAPPQGENPQQRYWTRQGLAIWLAAELRRGRPTIVGIDYGFSFPLAYFHQYELAHDWPAFLEDFQMHWPTDGDHTYVDFVRDGVEGNGAARRGNARWRRLTEVRTKSAKSLFHFDVPGAVAKATHAGLPWLRYLRRSVQPRPHFWPFDGWEIPAGSSAIVEVYPRLWNSGPLPDGLTPDQYDAFTVAKQIRDADRDGRLQHWLQGNLSSEERTAAEIEGWILGAGSDEPAEPRKPPQVEPHYLGAKADKLVFRRHALERMAERNVTVEDVRRILRSGETLREYPDEQPFPGRLTLGWIGRRPVHVVTALDVAAATTIIITVYEPDPTLWDATFRRKR